LLPRHAVSCASYARAAGAKAARQHALAGGRHQTYYRTVELRCRTVKKLWIQDLTPAMRGHLRQGVDDEAGMVQAAAGHRFIENMCDNERDLDKIQTANPEAR